MALPGGAAWVTVLLLAAALRADGGEAGWLRRRECLPGNGSDTLKPSGGLGSPNRLQARRGGDLLLRDQDFRIPPGDSLLVLAAPLPAGDSVCLDVAYTPLLADPVFRLYRLEQVQVYRPGVFDTTQTLAGPAGGEGGDTAYSKYRLNYSGSKSIAVTMGSGGGLGLDAALFINLNGQIAENVFVEGQLSDQNVPIQPEGNTTTLKEVDTKFMRVYGRNYSYVLGNYLLDFGAPGEDKYTAKVEGVDLSYWRGGYGVHGTLSVGDGQYQSDTLRGVDGKQRGYYLRGRDGRLFITVLAGTERLWRNGSPLQRGVDYTIDYSEGRIDFLNTVIVTSENIFAAEYQYTDQDYGRVLASGEARDTAGALTWSLRAISEIENKDHPLAFSFTPEEKTRLANLGDSLFRDSLGRLIPTPRQQSSAAADLAWQGNGHSSRAAVLLSQLDRNLYSTRDDEDNVGFSTRYHGTQILGKTLDKGGWGRTDLQFDHEYRSLRFESFKQLIEPRTFLETWNLDAQAGARGFLANRARVEERPFTLIMLGAEGGRAESQAPDRNPSDTSHAQVTYASESQRGSLFGKLGGDKIFLEASTEAKYARAPDRRDNFRQYGRARLEAAGLTPTFTLTRNEWLADAGRGRLARSIKDEPEFSFATVPLLGHLAFTTDFNQIAQTSNFGGLLPDLRDSVSDWGAGQKVEVLGLGPWSSDFFYSFRNHRQWNLDRNSAYSSTPEEGRFNQVDWNNHLADHRRGYSLVSTYRVNQTAEFPLVEAYEKVPAGRGNYTFDSLLNAYHQVETGGDYVLIGLKRDTTLGSRPYQDLAWTANLELTPARFPFPVKGVLADVEFILDMAMDHQDTSAGPGLLPLFTDDQIEHMRSGRSRYNPSIRWQSPAGSKAVNVSVDRVYTLSAGFYAFREKLLNQRADYRQEIGQEWEYALEQSFSDRSRQGLTAAATGLSENTSRGYGARVTRKLPRSFSLEGRGEYETVTGSTTLGATDLQGLKPAVKVEKTSLYNGRAFLEYGMIYYWGEGQGDFYATGGFQRGLTHRVEANANFQVGRNMYLNFDYVVRLEPEASRPAQKMTAEARAVF
jgi:hypothetical protein